MKDRYDIVRVLMCAALAACSRGGPEAGRETTGGEATLEAEPAPSTAEARMQATEGNDVSGTVRFEESAEGLLVHVDLTGVPPSTEHGFHVHENGDCSAPDASSAGDHYSPEGHPHGLPEGEGPMHAGDMGNLVADANGEVHRRMLVQTMSVGGDRPSVIGRAVILHAEPDDGGQPSGNAGGRIACGVVRTSGTAQLGARVHEALSEHVDMSTMWVAVDAHHVHLRGTVSSREQLHTARRAARSVPGVHQVHTRELRVGS